MNAELIISPTAGFMACGLFPVEPENDGLCENCGSIILLGRKSHHLTWCKPANVVAFVAPVVEPEPQPEEAPAVNVAQSAPISRSVHESLVSNLNHFASAPVALGRESAKTL